MQACWRERDCDGTCWSGERREIFYRVDADVAVVSIDESYCTLATRGCSSCSRAGPGPGTGGCYGPWPGFRESLVDLPSVKFSAGSRGGAGSWSRGLDAGCEASAGFAGESRATQQAPRRLLESNPSKNVEKPLSSSAQQSGNLIKVVRAREWGRAQLASATTVQVLPPALSVQTIVKRRLAYVHDTLPARVTARSPGSRTPPSPVAAEAAQPQIRPQSWGTRFPGGGTQVGEKH